MHLHQDLVCQNGDAPASRIWSAKTVTHLHQGFGSGWRMKRSISVASMFMVREVEQTPERIGGARMSGAVLAFVPAVKFCDVRAVAVVKLGSHTVAAINQPFGRLGPARVRNCGIHI